MSETETQVAWALLSATGAVLAVLATWAARRRLVNWFNRHHQRGRHNSYAPRLFTYCPTCGQPRPWSVES